MRSTHEGLRAGTLSTSKDDTEAKHNLTVGLKDIITETYHSRIQLKLK